MSAKHKNIRRRSADGVGALSRREFIACAAAGGVAAIGAVPATASTPTCAQKELAHSERGACRELTLLGQYGGEFGDLPHASDTAKD